MHRGPAETPPGDLGIYYDRDNQGAIVDIRLNIIDDNWYLLGEATLFDLV